MTSFLRFEGTAYYPSGGLRDLVGTFDSLTAAIRIGPASNVDWCHVAEAGGQYAKIVALWDETGLEPLAYHHNYDRAVADALRGVDPWNLKLCEYANTLT